VTELEKEVITLATAEQARARISPNQTYAASYYDPQKLTATREAGTSHMAIVDKDGMSVSLTTTVNLYFGAQISEYLGNSAKALLLNAKSSDRDRYRSQQ
jgi:gamma-glutamyltranspeptidase/glutathione hydrolase